MKPLSKHKGFFVGRKNTGRVSIKSGRIDNQSIKTNVRVSIFLSEEKKLNKEIPS